MAADSRATGAIPRARPIFCLSEHRDRSVAGRALIPEVELLPIVTTWLTTAFEGGRHARRIALIDAPGAETA
jgi:hypothetical protein